MKLHHLALAAALALGLPAATLAADSDAITVEKPYARAVPPTARNSGAFMRLRNDSDQPVKVVAAKSDVSRVTELHTHVHDKGVMRMRRVEFIEVPPHGSVELKPGGYHVMLIGLEKPLKPGDPVHIELTFGDGSRERIALEAVQTGMMPMKGMDHTHHMKMPMKHGMDMN